MVNFSVFNELSLPVPIHVNIVKIFTDFFTLLEETKKKGLNTLRMSRDFKNYEILQNVNFQQFLGQQQDRDFKRKIAGFLMNRGIVLIDNPIIKAEENEAHNNIMECEYSYYNQKIDGGLACCDVWNTIAISFNSDKQWDTDKLVLKKDSINSDSTIKQNTIKIKHASKTEHLKAHQDFFKKLKKELKLNINQENFWKQKKEFFPDIVIFCSEVEAQIRQLDTLVFQQAMSLLRDVETHRKLMTDFNHSGEGQIVHNNPQLRSMREFTIGCKKVFFEKHVKSLPNGHRIYFLERERKIHIGYIGKHLKDATN